EPARGAAGPADGEQPPAARPTARTVQASQTDQRRRGAMRAPLDMCDSPQGTGPRVGPIARALPRRCGPARGHSATFGRPAAAATSILVPGAPQGPAGWEGTVELDIAAMSSTDVYKLLVGSVVPRPIAFVSTLSAD